jgi:hypothetical protein
LTGSGPPSVQTPIVVNDSRGFYTSRVFGTYTREAMLMLVEGDWTTSAYAPHPPENTGNVPEHGGGDEGGGGGGM